jgi:radical SAM protein with 4Fe4S-binding SPASM domain
MIPTETDILRRLAKAGLKPPKTVTLAVTNRCNLSCLHCWPDSGPDAEATEVSKNKVSRLIDGFAALGAETLVITGGEPLTHPDWFDLLSYACTRSGIREVRLQTNAILITPAHVNALLTLKDRGLTIQTSLEGATPRAHDQVRGTGSFDRTMQGLGLLVKEGMASRICITFTEMRHNFEDIPDLMKLADKMGIGQFITGTLVSGGRAAQPGGLAPPLPVQYEKLLERFQDDKTFKERYHRIGNIAALEWFMERGDAASNCCTFIETPYVTAQGNLYPCVMLHADDFAATGVYDHCLTISIAENIESWSRLQRISRSRLTRLDTCKECTAHAKCGAGCMGRAYSAYGDFLAVEDRCSLRKAIYQHNDTPGNHRPHH